MRNWAGDDEERIRVAGFMLDGLRRGGIIESPGDYFTKIEGGYLGCADAIALSGMLGNANRAYEAYCQRRQILLADSLPWHAFCGLLGISRRLAHQIDWLHSHGVPAVTIAIELRDSQMAFVG